MAPTTHDIEMLHKRIGELKDAVGSLTVEIRESIALCGVCRPKVLGNGKEPMDVRIARLEETKASTAWWITKILAVCSVVTGVVSVAVTLAVKWLSG